VVSAVRSARLSGSQKPRPRYLLRPPVWVLLGVVAACVYFAPKDAEPNVRDANGHTLGEVKLEPNPLAALSSFAAVRSVAPRELQEEVITTADARPGGTWKRPLDLRQVWWDLPEKTQQSIGTCGGPSRDNFIKSHTELDSPSELLGHLGMEEELSDYDLGILKSIADSYNPVLVSYAVEAANEIDRSFSEDLAQGKFVIWGATADRPLESPTQGSFGFSVVTTMGHGLRMSFEYDTIDHPRVEALISQIADVKKEINDSMLSYLSGM
jgi:hypothetical protein